MSAEQPRKRKRGAASASALARGNQGYALYDEPNEEQEQRLFTQEYEHAGENPNGEPDVVVIEHPKKQSKARKKTSIVYQYFNTSDASNASCLECEKNGAKFTSNIQQATSHAILHLESAHSITNTTSKSSGATKQPTVTQEMFHNALTQWIATTAQAFSVVDNSEFAKMLSLYRPNFSIPSPYKITQNISKLYENDRQNLKDLIDSTCETIALSLDIWTSDNHEAFLAIIGHWTTQVFNYEEHLLDFIHLEGRHTAEAQAALVLGCLQAYKIASKLVIMVGDNANVNPCLADIVQKLITSELNGDPSDFHGRESFVGCLAHQLNLMVQEILKNRFVALKKVKAIAKETNLQPQQREKWKKLSGDKNKFIERNVKTRWNSTLRMIQDALDCRTVADEYAKLCQLDETRALNNDDWALLTQLCTMLKPFEEVTNHVSESQPTIAEGLMLYMYLRDLYVDAELVTKNQAHLVTNQFMMNMDKSIVAAVMRSAETFIEYYEKTFKLEVFGICSVLDPRYKNSWIEPAKKHNQTALDNFEALVINNIEVRLSDLAEAKTPNSSQSDVVATLSPFETWKRKLMPQPRNEEQSEIRKFLQDKHVGDEEKFNLLGWWRDVGSKQYPLLAQVARQFLSVPSASACVERVFNASKDQYGVRRHRLSASRFRQLIMLQRSQRELERNTNA
jgi:hypothetical protein